MWHHLKQTVCAQKIHLNEKTFCKEEWTKIPSRL